MVSAFHWAWNQKCSKSRDTRFGGGIERKTKKFNRATITKNSVKESILDLTIALNEGNHIERILTQSWRLQETSNQNKSLNLLFRAAQA